jgi:hypothetical protein
MAMWRIYPDLRVTYQDPRVQDGAEQSCGKPDNAVCQFEDVLAWAAREGDAGDVMRTSRGVFFVQGAMGLH